MSAEREAKLNETLEYILNVLKTQYEPEKVILFGSLAAVAAAEDVLSFVKDRLL